MQSIESADQPVLDLKYIAFSDEVKGLGVIGTWFFAPLRSGMRAQPCLVIMRRDMPPSAQRPFMVLLENKYMWDENPLIGDPVAIQASARDACSTLGLNPTSSREVNRVIDAVRLRLRDLQDIPPPPTRESEVIGEAVIKMNGTEIEGVMTRAN